MRKSIHTDILDKGFIKVYGDGYLGSDLTVVNSARVSFGKRKEKLDESDIKLMKYLKDNNHYSPFRHIQVQFHVKAPEIVTRQWYKHVVGIETTSSYPTKDHAWNEKSLRYVKVDEFYVPEVWRAQSEDNKQGSSGEIKEQKKASDMYDTALKVAFGFYEDLIELGVAKEQARSVVPLSVYTEFYWTASFQAIMNFLELRLDSHAQWEIRKYAQKMKEIMYELFPVVSRIWLEPKIKITDIKKYME